MYTQLNQGEEMLIYGHPWIKSNIFRKVFKISDIKETNPDDIILLEPLVDSILVAQYCQANSIKFAVTVTSTTEAIFANALDASFVISPIEEGSFIQSVAQDYLFDTKVLVLINEEKDISKMARVSIDGVIFPSAIIA